MKHQPSDFRFLKSSIPHGSYCYFGSGLKPGSNCPFWDIDLTARDKDNGYCHYLGSGDNDDEAFGLLWDQCKACGINED
jgi:hypothetical protein